MRDPLQWLAIFFAILPAVGAAAMDCTPVPLAHIAPGTRVGAEPPDGWTHLIFKARPQLATGDVDKIPDLAKPLSQFLANVMLARVERSAAGFQLAEVAVGLATRIGQEDVVIDSGTQEALGADLGLGKEVVLGRAEEQLAKFRRVAAGAGAWIVETPALMAIEGANRPIVLRYLFLVDAPTGRLASFVWRINCDAQGKYLGARGDAVLIEPGLVGVSPLHVDGSRFLVGIPQADAIAITRLPRGTPFEMPDALRDLAGRSRYTPDEARALCSAFARALGFAQ